ncbi:hypothetical protein [Saccharothrix sp. ST-888]|uniref:hypothetical protein n=1 Tax=Saccharothrix sp. ST-888 TaxID=1427391 RepID=UPI0005ECFF0B|nr:hypothetical protein [Saccharothrix sp. ST-888]KJK56346.1 hypothetical protein UK12_23195 [Saccharothrix sp. ST-888]
MRTFSVGDREYAALIILSDFNEFEAMEVTEFTAGVRGKLVLEFRMTDESCWLESIGDGVEIPLLRRAIDVFREEFLEPRWQSGAPTPPW